MKVERRQLAAAADIGLGIAAVAGLLVEAWVRRHSAVGVTNVLLATAIGVSVSLRRRGPVLSLAVTVVLLLLVLPGTHSTHVALAVAMVSAGTVAYQGDRRVSLAVGVALVPVVVLAWLEAGGDGVGQEFFTYLVSVIAAVVAGDAIRSRRDVTVARRERELVAREAAARELFDEYRLQLGRDLHDSLAHALVAITTRAGVAQHLGAGSGQPELLAALGDVKQVSAAALQELRETLQSLRSDQAAPTTPTISSELTLQRLARPLSMAGLSLQLSCDPAAELAPSQVSHAGYRIVQESLTNVLKHAQAQTVMVSLAVEEDILHVVISNDGPVVCGPSSTQGHGLVGMHERAGSVGGVVTAGPREEGGWLVSAQLPMSA